MDYEKLRKDLIDYYGSAMLSGFPMAVVELPDVEIASDKELTIFAKEAGLDILDYEEKEEREQK